MPDICKVEQYQPHTFMQSTYGKISKMKWQFANLRNFKNCNSLFTREKSLPILLNNANTTY